jgi:hypothetical protein
MKVPSKRLMFKLFLEPCLRRNMLVPPISSSFIRYSFRSQGSVMDENKGTKSGK